MSTQPVSEPVLSEVLTAHRDLLVAEDVPEAIQTTLDHVGRAARVDRVYVFQIDRTEKGEALASQRFEWVSSRVPPQIDNPVLQELPLRSSGYSRWLDSLEACVPIVGAVADFPPREQPTLEEQGILSILVLPLFAGSDLWGFIGFDDCTQGRTWTHAEVDLLITLSLAVGIALSGRDHSPLESAVEIYMRVASRLLQVHTVAFTETSPEIMIRRTQARIRVLARSYRYFTALHVPDRIDSQEFLEELQPLFAEIRTDGCTEGDAKPWRIRVETDSVVLGVERALDTAVLLGEVLASVVDHFYENTAEAAITLAMQRVENRLELTVTARDCAGAPVGDGQVLDGMALALFRHVQERLPARFVPGRTPGELFHISFPLRTGSV